MQQTICQRKIKGSSELLFKWLREWKNLRDIPIHDICTDLGPSRSMALPLFHAITGCDTTSHFLGCGKKTAWASWQNTPGLTETLLALTNAPSCFSLESLHMEKLERFVVVMYSKGCGLAKVNEARHRLFTSGKKTLESIPPSQAALFEHIKRALLQASFYWNQSTSVHQEIPDFREWGWQREDSGVWLPRLALSIANFAIGATNFCLAKLF